MINSDLLDILVCPETKQSLVLVDEKQLESINERIRNGELRSRTGKEVTEQIDSALVRKDGLVAYPVRESIPIMLVDESFSL